MIWLGEGGFCLVDGGVVMQQVTVTGVSDVYGVVNGGSDVLGGVVGFCVGVLV